jgi:hypothetical protein
MDRLLAEHAESRFALPRTNDMKSLFPAMTSFIAGTLGWALGAKVEGRFTAIILSLLGTCLGFYYGRKYIKEMLG